MIKVNELQEYRPTVKYQDGNNITLECIRTALSDAAQKMNIPVAFVNDVVKEGGLLNSKTTECLVMYHPEHRKDYYNYCIRVLYQGAYAYVSVELCGESKQGNKAYRSSLAKSGIKDYFKADAEDYNAIGRAIGQTIGGALGSLGKSKKKLAEEETYYKFVSEIIDEVIC